MFIFFLKIYSSSRAQKIIQEKKIQELDNILKDINIELEKMQYKNKTEIIFKKIDNINITLKDAKFKDIYRIENKIVKNTLNKIKDDLEKEKSELYAENRKLFEIDQEFMNKKREIQIKKIELLSGSYSKISHINKSSSEDTRTT